MKKVSMLVLLAIVASSLLMAAIPTSVVRLTMINKSGGDVYMKLEGSALTGQFYYLTVPSGTRSEPVVKVFTVMSDLYTRTTWQCGVKSSGTLLVDGNIRLTFTPCGEKACGWTAYTLQFWGCHKDLTLVATAHRYAGEPRMEKVTYFKYLAVYQGRNFFWSWPWVNGYVHWNNAYLYTGWWNFGCGVWAFRIRSYQLPYGCAWRYQY
jgi:hypothetical protein